MLWHAKALETLSDAYNSLQISQTDLDLENFRSILNRAGNNLSICGPDALDYYSPKMSNCKSGKKKFKLGSITSIKSVNSKQSVDSQSKLSFSPKNKQLKTLAMGETKLHVSNCALNRVCYHFILVLYFIF